MQLNVFTVQFELKRLAMPSDAASCLATSPAEPQDLRNSYSDLGAKGAASSTRLIIFNVAFMVLSFLQSSYPHPGMELA